MTADHGDTDPIDASLSDSLDVAVASLVRVPRSAASAWQQGQPALYRWPWSAAWMPAHVEHVCTEGPRRGTIAVRLDRRRIVVIGIEPTELRVDLTARPRPEGEGPVRS
jgi:hypothetical protein